MKQGQPDPAAIDAASLEELKARYPDEWERTGRALVEAVERRRAEGAAELVARARAAAAPWRARLGQSGGNPKVARAALPYLVRERMARLAVEQLVSGAVATTTGASGTLRFGWWSGTLVQRLFFAGGLARKPASMGWFRALWPLVTQKKALMPLVEPKGIYCFHSGALVRALAGMIGDRPALEIAAGDGTLSRFLRAEGTQVVATDDHSWQHAITFPADVERLNAKDALARHLPRVVICSWPPPENTFEREVFRTPSVERYIVITTRHRFAAGTWSDYESQTAFTRTEDQALSRLVLPPEIDPVVLIFDRR
jgi:hypothetical protein